MEEALQSNKNYINRKNCYQKKSKTVNLKNEKFKIRNPKKKKFLLEDLTDENNM